MSKPSKLQAILNIIKGVEIVNKVVYTADEKEINFPDLGEEDAILIGAKATVDGQLAEGEIVSADGTIYVFAGGILEEIKESTEDVEDEVSEEEMIDALTQMLELAVDVEKRVNEMETQITGMVKERDEFKTKFETATATIAKLKGTSTTVVTEPVDKTEKKTNTSSIVAQWKSNKNKKNKKLKYGITRKFCNGVADLVDSLVAADKVNINEAIFQQTFGVGSFTQAHTLITEVRNGKLQPIVLSNDYYGSMPLGDETSCDLNSCDLTPNYSTKEWCLAEYNCRLDICMRSFDENFLLFLEYVSSKIGRPNSRARCTGVFRLHH